MNASKTNQPSPPPPPPLEEKIQSALTTLRRDREKDYRTMLEAQERERHAKDELVALETMVEELTKQKTLLIQENETVKTQLPSLESHVNDLAEQADFQHQELLAARAKIQQQQTEMEALAIKRTSILQKMRQLAHDRTLKLTHMKQLNEQSCRTTTTGSSRDTQKGEDDQHSTTATTTGSVVPPQVAAREAFEREMDSLLFDWETIPQLIKDKAQLYLNHAKELAVRNEEMTRELASAAAGAAGSHRMVGGGQGSSCVVALVETVEGGEEEGKFDETSSSTMTLS